MREDLCTEIAAMIRAHCSDPREGLLVLSQVIGDIVQAAPPAQKATLFGFIVLAIARGVEPPFE